MQEDVLQELNEISRETIPQIVWIAVFAFAISDYSCAHAVNLLTASNQHG
jgi:hypothetical protein